jgi:hypothetical protein
MSYKVLVIPEDPTFNGYILRPVIDAVLQEAGKPRAKVTVLTNPRLGGYDHAKKAILDDLPDRYRFWDLWIFVPDADRASPEAMAKLEEELRQKSINLLCCPAQPEVEIYCCVAYREQLSLSWELAREHHKFKEEVFQPLLDKNGDYRRPSGGRDLMIDESLKNMAAFFQFCPEMKRLRDRIVNLL